MYFGKSAKDLDLTEAATIAGIFQAWRRARRQHAVAPAAGANYVAAADGRRGLHHAGAGRRHGEGAPIVLRGEDSQRQRWPPTSSRRSASTSRREYGAKQVYEGGLVVQTSLDTRLQKAADEAMDRGLRRLDKLSGFRKPEQNVIAEKHDIDTWQAPRWSSPIEAGDIVPAVVLAAERSRIEVRGPARPAPRHDRAGGLHVDPPAARAARAARRRHRAGEGDVDRRQDHGRHPGAGPLVEGALLAIDNRTGQIRAMVGGYDFDRSKFNRALQAHRQVGSTFKPFVYTAAIDRGYTPSYIIDDVPTEFDAGPDQPPYAPPNYDLQFEGPITLRRALEDSRNVPAVKMMQMLGPDLVISYAPPVRRQVAHSAVPVGGARLGGGDAARDDAGLLGLPQPGRADDALLRAEGAGPRRQRARGGTARRARRHPRRHGVHHDARCSRAWCSGAPAGRPPPSTGRSAGRPARPTTTPTRGSSASTRTSPWASGWDYDQKQPIGTAPDRQRPPPCRSGSTS